MKKHASIRSLVMLVIASAFCITSCNKKDLAVGLTTGVSPNSSVIVPVGNVSSCADLLNQPTSATTPPPQSVSAPSLSFTNFTLNWTPTDEKLYVKAIRMIVTGVGIQGGKVSTYMATDEISAMLKTPIVLGGAITGYTGVNGAVNEGTDIESFGAAKTTVVALVTPVSVACGFTMGGISLTQGDQTPSFTANVSIEVIGVAIKDSDQTQRVIIQTTTATAQYIGINQ